MRSPNVFKKNIGLPFPYEFLHGVAENRKLPVGFEAARDYLFLQQASGDPSRNHLRISPSLDIRADQPSLKKPPRSETNCGRMGISFTFFSALLAKNFVVTSPILGVNALLSVR
jgi:hypothetical protein